jgi:hypothetical protein
MTSPNTGAAAQTGKNTSSPMSEPTGSMSGSPGANSPAGSMGSPGSAGATPPK